MQRPRPCCGARLSSDRGKLGDQLDSLLDRHMMTKNRSGTLVPLARAIMKHRPLPVLTAEQEAELFAPVNSERVLRPSEMEHPVADAKSKSDIYRQLDKIKNNNSNSDKKKAKPLDMSAGGIVRKST
jgi:hypothetical protein